MNLQQSIRRILKEETDRRINPVQYFYYNYLNENPLEFEGLTLSPTYNEENNTITWDVDNPEDYSFNYNVLIDFILDEFEAFCKLINVNYYQIASYVDKFYNKPRSNCYLNDKDYKTFQKYLRNKKNISLDVDNVLYEMDIRFLSYEILTYGYTTIEINAHYDYINITKTIDGKKEKITRSDLFDGAWDDHLHDTWEDNEWDFFREIIDEIIDNKRFYYNNNYHFDLILN